MSEANDERLLRDLGRRAAERARDEAAREGVPDADPRLRAASTPLDAAARKRIVDRLEAFLDHENEPVLTTPTRDDRAVGVTLPPAYRRLVLPLAAVLIAVLSALAYRASIAPATDDALPHYTVRVEGTVAHLRGPGEPEPDAVLAPGNRLQVVATPERPVTGTLAARAFIGDGAGWRAIDPAYVAVSGQGAARLDAIIGRELALDTGRHHLLLLLGAPRALPDPDEAAAGADVTGLATGPRWRAFLWTFEVSSPP